MARIARVAQETSMRTETYVVAACLLGSDTAAAFMRLFGDTLHTTYLEDAEMVQKPPDDQIRTVAC